MIAADTPGQRAARLLTVGPDGDIRHRRRSDLATLVDPGDVVVANDAATLPASLHGHLEASGAPVEIRLAGWISAGDPTRFVAIAFGQGDHRTRTEHRPPPPPLAPGGRLRLGLLTAIIERLLDHPRLMALRFVGDKASVLAGLAGHGRPIQYAHVPTPLALWDVWTAIAADPVAFEPPSAGFALDWRTIATWRARGIRLATLTHAAGISSTGDAALDARLPFDEPYRIPDPTSDAIRRAKRHGHRIIALGTTVVRALEAAAGAAGAGGGVVAGAGIARNRIGPETRLAVPDAVLTGMHAPGESHYELLRAFAADGTLRRAAKAAQDDGYRSHEFGDVMLLSRQRVARAAGSHRSASARRTPKAPKAPAKPRRIQVSTRGLEIT